MKNSGTITWTQAGGYKLGSQNPQDNDIWTGGTRIYLSPSDAIAPGQSKTFTFDIMAPVAPDTYGFQWRMVQEGVEWFGQQTSNQDIYVHPLRAAFYYPWYPEHWWDLNDPFTHYTPTLEFYDSSNSTVIQNHIQAMEYGNFDAGLSSWWGRGTPTDNRTLTLLNAAIGHDFYWAVYYEDEGYEDPSTSVISDDLAYLNNHYFGHSNYLHMRGRPVVFVYGGDGDNCAMAERWKDANPGSAYYIVLKVFGDNYEYEECFYQPDGWHQYGPAVRTDNQWPYAFTISPGFWFHSEATPRLTRNISTWCDNIQSMVASTATFHLVTTFNEWEEGTSVESAQDGDGDSGDEDDGWESASGYGEYLDALHNNGQGGICP